MPSRKAYYLLLVAMLVLTVGCARSTQRASKPEKKKKSTVVEVDSGNSEESKEVEWRREAKWVSLDSLNGRKRFLEVVVEADGEKFRDILALGEVKIDDAKDGNGKSLSRADEIGFVDDRLANEMVKPSSIDGMEQPKGGFRFPVRFNQSSPVGEIGLVEGSLKVRLGRVKVVTIEDIASQAEKGIDDESLKEAGIEVNFTRNTSVAAKFTSEGDRVAEARLVNGEGERIASPTSIHRLPFGDEVTRSFTWNVKEGLPEGARLQVLLDKDVQVKEIPFSFSKLDVPPVPKDYFSRSSGNERVIERGGLKLAARVVRDPESQRGTRVVIDVQGPAAGKASQIGFVDVAPIADLKGKAAAFPTVPDGYHSVKGSSTFVPQPKNGLRLAIDLNRDKLPKVLKTVRGSFKIRVPKSEGVFIDLKKLQEEGNAALKEAGVQANFKVDTDLTVQVTGDTNKLYDAAVVDTKGKELGRRAQTGTLDGKKRFKRMVVPQTTEGKLEVRLVQDPKVVKLPFKFENIEVPSMPEN